MTSEEDSRRVHVVVTLRIRPGTEARMLAVFGAVAEVTRQEAACVRYELFRAVDDELRYALVEEWRDRAGLDAHLQMPYMQSLQAAMPEILAEPPDMKVLAARG